MKKAMLMLALLVVSFAVQAQTKFHDLEVNDVKGPVKSVTTSVMGNEQTITFTTDGKMQQEGMTDAVYDADGYMQSAKVEAMGVAGEAKYSWENGKVVGITMKIMGQEMTTKITYDDNGMVAKQTMNMAGQEFESPYTDYKFDDKGNWISRKASMMGQEMVQTRTIEYYE